MLLGADESAASPVDRGDGEVVLVIDDEPSIRMLIGEVLQENGYEAIDAVDGPAAGAVAKSSGRTATPDHPQQTHPGRGQCDPRSAQRRNRRAVHGKQPKHQRHKGGTDRLPDQPRRCLHA